MYNFKRNSFLKWWYYFILLSPMHASFSCCTSLLASGVVILILVILTSVKCYLITTLIFITMMTKILSTFSYAYWPFLYLLLWSVSLFCPFLIGLSLCYWFVRVLYILQAQYFVELMFYKYFLPVHGLLLYFLNNIFRWKDIFYFGSALFIHF